MKILSWNINGIRTIKQPLNELLDSFNADIICFQETKVSRDFLDGATALVPGYNSYFSFSKIRSGYSGVATFCKDNVTPCRAEAGLSGYMASDSMLDAIGCYGNLANFTDYELRALDSEGRAVLTQHQLRLDDGECRLLVIINIYCPRADPEREDRKTFKLRFYELLRVRAESLLDSGMHVLIVGDMNTSHKPIDHCDPYEEFGSRPDRKWFDDFLDNSSSAAGTPHGHKFIDSYRYFHPTQDGAFTCWRTTTGARLTNYGTRIDYIIGDRRLVETSFLDSVLMQDVEGSDHCPVVCDINCKVIASTTLPSLCTKLSAKFVGKQQKLTDLFSMGSNAISIVDAASNCDNLSTVNSSNFELMLSKSGNDNRAPKKAGSNLGKLKSKCQKRKQTKQHSLLSFFGRSEQSDLAQCANCSGVEHFASSSNDSHAKERVLDEQKTYINLPVSQNSNLSDILSCTSDSDTCLQIPPLSSDYEPLLKYPYASIANTPSGEAEIHAGETSNDLFVNEDAGCEKAFDETSTGGSASVPTSFVQMSEEGGNYTKEMSADKFSEPQNKLVESQKESSFCGSDSGILESETSEQLGHHLLDNLPNIFQFNKQSLTAEMLPDDDMRNPSRINSGLPSLKTDQVNQWRFLLKGLPPPPLCRGHSEACVLRTVKKPGPNFNRRFYVCARPEGHKTNKEARCNHFQWLNKKR